MFYFNDLLFFLDEPAPWVEDPSILKWRFPVANNVTLVDDQRAIFLLSMGQEAAQSTIVERCLLSIRRVGYYLGPVILLTDVPENRYRSLTYSDPNFIVLHPPESDWQWNLRDDMPYKRFKTFTLEYLKLDDRLDHVELVYYLDIDVVVGRPLAPWFDHVESTYLHVKRDGETNGRSGELYQTKGRMIFFKGNSKRRPLQGGQFLVQRETSQPCLDRWRYYIDQHPEDPKDQSALTLILQEQNNATTPCSLSIMPQTPYLRFLDANGMQEMISTKAYPTLMHIKNTEHADWIPNRIQKRFFQQVLDLSEEEAALVGKTQIHPSDRKHQ
jgi:hypothetical protein